MTKVAAAFSLLGMAYFVYILASQRNGTLYVGVTNDLVRRIYEHREKLIEGFTSQYNVTRLVWFDQTASIEEAIAHEKRLKRWQREWKIALIEKSNPNWDDLYESIL
jgi:putative endonuclease